MGNELELEVFVGEENAFHVTSSIVTGERDAVLIDAQFTRTDARRLAGRIKELGKNLTTVYITHGHPDHYLGLTTLREQFPDARLVTAPEVLGEIDDTVAASVAQWKPLYGDEVPGDPVLPEPFEADVIELEGTELQVVHIGQGDSHDSTIVSIPTLSTVVAGDLAYNGTHVWLAETDAEARAQWIANLEALAEISPAKVIAGHKVPDADDEGGRVLLTETRDYVAAFDAAAARAANEEELVKAVTEQYGNRALPMILEIAAQAMFAQGH